MPPEAPWGEASAIPTAPTEPRPPAPPDWNGSPGVGVGGGLDLIAVDTAVIDNTSISGNHASTIDDDVAGTFTM